MDDILDLLQAVGYSKASAVSVTHPSYITSIFNLI